MSAASSLSLLSRTVLTVSEAYCSGRRVALVGPSTSKVAEGLLDAGARSVHHYATDGVRGESSLRRGERSILVRALPAGEFDVREGAFDLVVVEDLARLGDLPSWLGRFRRLVGASGVLVAGAPRRGGAPVPTPTFDVHELDELVSVQFAWVDLRGLAPFHGAVVASIGTPGAIGDFVVYPLDDARASPSELVVIASQKPRAVEPSMLLEVEPSEPAAAHLAALAPANDGDVRLVASLREEHARALAKLAEERADLLDTIALREDALRASEAEGDRLRREIDELTVHLDRALEGAVPAHLARLEALADKDRVRVVEGPLARADRVRFEMEIAAADAARAEADASCVRVEQALHRSEVFRKGIEAELAALREAFAAQAARSSAIEDAYALFREGAAQELDDLETRLRDLAFERARAAESERAAARFLRADRLRMEPAPVAGRGEGLDEGVLVGDLLRERALADLRLVELQALRARLARIVEAVDDASTSPVDTEAPEPRLAAVSPPSAASSLPAVTGPHSDDG